MELSIIIVSYNTKEVLRKCLQLIYEDVGKIKTEILIADNASHDGSPDMVEKEFPDVRLIRCDRNYGFGKANNIAMKEAKGEYFLLINSDAYIKPGVLKSTLDYMKNHQDVGVLGGETGWRGGQPSAFGQELSKSNF